MNQSNFNHRAGSGATAATTAPPPCPVIAVVLTTFVLLTPAPQKCNASTADNWITNSGGSWNTGTNWSTASIPTTQHDAVIGSSATSAASPAAITLDATQTVYGITLDPGAGKSIHIDRGSNPDSLLKLLSNDMAPDGVAKFFTVNVLSGDGNQINAPIMLNGANSVTLPAMINSSDSAFAIRGGIFESARTWSVRISGSNQGIVSYATTTSTYSGDTTITTSGILRVDVNNAIPNGADKGNVVLEGNGQLQFLNATAQTINALNSSSSTSVVTSLTGNNGVTLTVGNAGASGSYVGAINNPDGTGLFNLVKTGAGTQKLNGLNTYRGTTTVAGGTLLINGVHSNAGKYITSASTTLGGKGTINLAATNSVNVTTGSLAPGDGGPGVLNINGTLNIGGIGTLKVELGGAFPGNGATFYDQVNMTSPAAAINASVAHIAVTLVNGFRPQPTDVFYILTRADTAPFGDVHTFDSYPEGATINFDNGLRGQITYKANWTGNQKTSTVTGGNDMAIFNVAPEPSSAVLLAMGALALALSNFRKRQHSCLKFEG